MATHLFQLLMGGQCSLFVGMWEPCFLAPPGKDLARFQESSGNLMNVSCVHIQRPEYEMVEQEQRLPCLSVLCP